MSGNFLFGQIDVYTPISQETAERGTMVKSQQVALVTGASSGIGQATAELLASNGFVVFGTSRNPEKAARAYQWLSLDVRSDISVEAAVQSLLDQTGRIDLLVNNAGYSQVGSIEESSIADTQAQFDTNVFGAMRMIKAILPVMRQQGSGRIINVSSVVGQVAPPYVGVYAASKFALEGLSEALRAEVWPFGIRVSMVEPAFVKTHITSQPPTNPLAIYTPGRLAATHLLATNLAKGMKPSVVARVILHAATTTQPRQRYLVGRDAKLLVALKRLLSGPLFERMGRRIFRAGTSTAQALPTHLQATVTPD